jgi:hypothetical protein
MSSSLTSVTETMSNSRRVVLIWSSSVRIPVALPKMGFSSLLEWEHLKGSASFMLGSLCAHMLRNGYMFLKNVSSFPSLERNVKWSIFQKGIEIDEANRSLWVWFIYRLGENMLCVSDTRNKMRNVPGWLGRWVELVGGVCVCTGAFSSLLSVCFFLVLFSFFCRSLLNF